MKLENYLREHGYETSAEEIREILREPGDANITDFYEMIRAGGVVAPASIATKMSYGSPGKTLIMM